MCDVTLPNIRSSLSLKLQVCSTLPHIALIPASLAALLAFHLPSWSPVTAVCLCPRFASALTLVNSLLFRKSTLWCPWTSTHLLFTTAYPPWVVKRWSLSQMTLDERRRCTTDKSPAFRKRAAIKFYLESLVYLEMPAISTEVF